MTNQIRKIIIVISGFFLFFVDRFFKYLSLNNPEEYLLTNWLGWMPFKNPGIAFSLPLPSNLSIAISIPILLAIVYFILHNNKNESVEIFESLIILFIGALSNLWDRIYYRVTLDYFLIGTSVINLADIMILLGIGYLFFSSLVNKK